MSSIPLLQFERTTNAFNFVFERDLKAGEMVIVKMPTVSANKRGVNDIGWITNGNVRLSGTFAKDPKSDKALWQQINDNDEVNKTTAALKIENMGGACRIEMRAIFN
jgi:hypothetical protein